MSNVYACGPLQIDEIWHWQFGTVVRWLDKEQEVVSCLYLLAWLLHLAEISIDELSRHVGKHHRVLKKFFKMLLTAHCVGVEDIPRYPNISWTASSPSERLFLFLYCTSILEQEQYNIRKCGKQVLVEFT